MATKKMKTWIGGTAAAVWLLLAAAAPAAANEKIAYRLKWLINMSTVGDVFALEQGLFQAQGLAVEVKAGGPERDALRELELGHADFGVASADQVIRAVEKGAPLVVLAQLFQANPLQWIYRSARLSIDKPEDLAGKTIGVTYGKNDEFIMRTLLARADLDEGDVRLVSVRLDYTPFFKGDVDLWPIYINTQGMEIGTRLRQAGESVGFLEPEAFGVRFVANSVVTSQRMLAERPDTVRRFMQALLAGWRQALSPDRSALAVATVRKYDRDTSPAVLEAQLDATRRLVRTSPDRPVGAIDTAAWEQTARIMLEYHQISKPVEIRKVLKEVLENATQGRVP